MLRRLFTLAVCHGSVVNGFPHGSNNLLHKRVLHIARTCCTVLIELAAATVGEVHSISELQLTCANQLDLGDKRKQRAREVS